MEPSKMEEASIEIGMDEGMIKLHRIWDTMQHLSLVLFGRLLLLPGRSGVVFGLGGFSGLGTLTKSSRTRTLWSRGL